MTEKLEEMTKDQLIDLAKKLQVEQEKNDKDDYSNIYKTLSKIDVSQYVKKKMGLDYLSWATAWGLAESHYPNIQKKVTEFPEYIPTKDGWKATGRNVDYRLTPFGCEVEVTVTINGISKSQNLYVMDHKNKAVTYENLDIGAINKTQQRCLVKALALFGLGLNVYAGEDLPSGADKTPKRQERTSQSELISVAKKRKIQYGGGTELVTDIVGLDMDGDTQASEFLNQWCKKDKRNQNLYEFIRKNGLATHGMKVGA